MAFLKTAKGIASVAALFAGSAAQADVTATEIWENWKSQLTLYGDENIVIGAEETSGGTVTVRDLVITMSDDDVDVVSSIGDIVFSEQSDGTVRITMDETFPIIITGADGVVVTIDVTQRNLELIASGTADETSYAMSADTYGVAFRDAVDGGMTFTGDASLIATGVSGTYNVVTGDLRNFASDIAIDSVDVLVDFQIPGTGGEYITFAGKLSDMVSSGEATIPLDANFEDPDDLFVNGLAFSGGYAIGSADYVFDFNIEGDQAAGSVSTGSVTLNAELSSETMAYDSQTRDVAVALQAAAIPLPVEFSVGEYGFGFRMPVGVTEEPADFGMRFDMVDLEINEMLWSIFDPSAMLPRDPATFQIALTGKARALVDLLDPANEEFLESSEVPFEPYSVTLDTLRIALAGALVTGSGDFTFDNTDTQTFAPMPRPEGSAAVQISGLNGLLDNLVAMGLVPEQDIMGPRMMMGMFARSTGDDQMEIEVEVLPSGQVNVNGNRVR